MPFFLIPAPRNSSPLSSARSFLLAAEPTGDGSTRDGIPLPIPDEVRDAVRRRLAPLGRHLATAIKTGAFCSYTPDPTSPVT